MSETPIFIDDHLLRVGTADFYCAFPLDNAPEGLLPVMKGRPLVERYIALTRALRPTTIVELGIRRGGSTALLCALTDPTKLIAVEISRGPAPALRDYVEQQGLADVIRPYYGVDQSDRTRLSAIITDEFGGGSIDLVIDDASHRYRETLSSFETLFPHLRAGGLFVIEDWNGDHLVGDLVHHVLLDRTRPDHDHVEQQLQAARAAQRADPETMQIPLTQLAVELLLARASSGDAIREVTVSYEWVVIERGSEALDPETFRLSDLVHDHFGFTTRP